jgi:hypothetical protein
MVGKIGVWEIVCQEKNRSGVSGGPSGFMSRLRHSIDSSTPPSEWVSLTSKKFVAENFAGSSGSVFRFQVRRNQLHRTWWSPYPLEFESVVKGGTRIRNLVEFHND